MSEKPSNISNITSLRTSAYLKDLDTASAKLSGAIGIMNVMTHLAGANPEHDVSLSRLVFADAIDGLRQLVEEGREALHRINSRTIPRDAS